MSEQFVGQEMVLSQNVYYWSRREKSSSSEVDYVAVIDGGIHPVEVKSGASGTLKSLHLFLEFEDGADARRRAEVALRELPKNNLRILLVLWSVYFVASTRTYPLI